VRDVLEAGIAAVGDVLEMVKFDEGREVGRIGAGCCNGLGDIHEIVKFSPGMMEDRS